MEKVKLTKEQANAIEWALQKENEYSPDRLLRLRSSDNANFHNELYPLNDIDIAVLARALYIGYEVEPEFKVGDWVVSVKTGFVGTILDIFSDGMAHLSWRGSVAIKNLRHATPEEIQQEKERRWWAKHGREVWELKAGDFLIYKKFGTIEEVKEVNEQRYLIGKLTGYMELDYIKDNYSVAFFVEDRKDI